MKVSGLSTQIKFLIILSIFGILYRISQRYIFYCIESRLSHIKNNYTNKNNK